MAFTSRIVVLIVHLFFLLAQQVVSTPFAITGVEGSGVQPRLELRTLIREHPLQYNLYLQAYRAFQAEDEDPKLSYYRIAAIHYLPSIPWDGVTREAKGEGYCLHGEVLFAIWHRPFMAAFEMRLQHHAMEIAKKFKGEKRNQYIEAASTLRSPYWDWAQPVGDTQEAVPKALRDHHVSVDTPDGGKTIPNPLYSFEFHPLKKVFGKSFDKLPRTVRYPMTTSGPENIQSNNKKLLKAITKANKYWHNEIYRWFVNCPNYYGVNDAYPPKHANTSESKCGQTLESIHGDVHVTVGGFGHGFSGHMTSVPVAGYDPIFWLHHTNIDRLLAMWQEVYPTKFVYNSKISYHTYIYKSGEHVNQDTELKPFHKNTKGEFWTSREVRDTRVLKYTYPEFLTGGSGPAAMRKHVNELYGPKKGKTTESKRSEIDSSSASRRWENSGQGTTRAKRQVSANGLTNPLVAGNSSSFEYVANIITSKYKLGGSYAVYLFVGEPTDSNPESWIEDPNLAGSMGVFSTSGATDKGTASQVQISLTDILAKKVALGDITDLSEAVVVPFLTKFLEWKVVAPGGTTTIDPAGIPDFLVSVFASTVEPITDPEQFPEYSRFIPLLDVTDGKPGGL